MHVFSFTGFVVFVVPVYGIHRCVRVAESDSLLLCSRTKLQIDEKHIPKDKVQQDVAIEH
jgi:hypothetical protein